MSEKNLVDLIEIALRRPAPTPIFQVGQTVRIRKTLEVNTYEIREMLGKVGIVESVSASMIGRRNWYDVRVASGRCEPFEADELDQRYKRKAKAPEPTP